MDDVSGSFAVIVFLMNVRLVLVMTLRHLISVDCSSVIEVY